MDKAPIYAPLRTAIAAIAVVVLLGGCATNNQSPEAQQASVEANDPWEPTNRAIFSLNRTLDDNIGKPVARAYRDVVHEELRGFVHNFVNNVGEPVNFLNALLQWDGEQAAKVVARFFINSTLGVGGLGDPASEFGYEYREEDFGQTLAVWGVGEGPYVMLPVLGPANLRDAFGKVADSFSNPISYFIPTAGSLTITAAGGLDSRERNIETIDDIERNSLDYYAALRSLYRQNRRDKVNNGVPQGPVLDIPVYAE